MVGLTRILMVASCAVAIWIAPAVARSQAAPDLVPEREFDMQGIYHCVVELMAASLSEKMEECSSQVLLCLNLRSSF